MSTRSESYLKTLPELGARQREVYVTLRTFGPLTNRQLSKMLKRPINSITPRTRELVQYGMVTAVGETFDVDTRRDATLWGVVEA